MGLRIVFMGTPDFAVESLKILVENNYNIVGVVTAPDKPAGRGQQFHESAVKKYALTKGLTILQPEKLKNPIFIEQLQNLQADLQIIVAFRMLPEIVWDMPPYGSFNLHASLLPQYRGAAPINWAIINGEKETGVTTFFLQHAIDTGKIIFQEKTSIGENETAGDIHDKLMQMGAKLVLKTAQAIEINCYPQREQSLSSLANIKLREAPKIFKNDCKIDWSKNINEIHNKIRGLSPYPTAFTELISPEGKSYSIKLFSTEKEYAENPLHKNTKTQKIYKDAQNRLKVDVSGGYIYVTELQLAGKKRMTAMEFLRGFPLNTGWRVE